MYAGKPIIGIAGGIGSGKSFVARLFGEEGCLVLDADAAVRAAYETPAVKESLREWWGADVFQADGSVDRRAVARRVFADPAERRRLEGLLHPYAAVDRDGKMALYANDPNVRAYVWDIPLLFETGLDARCDAVVFVDVPFEQRLQRVSATRGWTAEDLRRREISQYPLDKKRAMSDYVLRNTADAASAREQVRDVLPRILAGSTSNHRPRAR